jgi:hypothetical protein
VNQLPAAVQCIAFEVVAMGRYTHEFLFVKQRQVRCDTELGVGPAHYVGVIRHVVKVGSPLCIRSPFKLLSLVTGGCSPWPFQLRA